MVELRRTPRAPDPDVWSGSIAGWDVPRFTERALCAETDPEEWFPEQGGSTAAAKAVCRQCPALAECRVWALSHDEKFGVWAGLSERQRHRLRNGRSAA
jgi:WhiB family redox-sensing transcriptional regulator